MLVQKQTPERLKKILLYGGIPIVLLGVYVLFVNISSKQSDSGSKVTVQTKVVPKDFGQQIFRDSRFYSLVPKSGTELITQAAVAIPSPDIPAPEVQAFDLRTGGTVLFTWKAPATLDANIIRIDRIGGESNENIVTLDARANAYTVKDVADNQEVGYQIYYARQKGLIQSGQVLARAGTGTDGLSVVAADGAGVRLQWAIRTAAQGKKTEVYRSDSAGSLGKLVAQLDAGSTAYDDTGGRADVHFYTLVWLDEEITGKQWFEKISTTDKTAPEAPDFVKVAYDAQNSAVRITWAPSVSQDVLRYDVYRANTAYTLGTVIGQKNAQDVTALNAETTTLQDCSNTLCFVDDQPKAGQTYYYTVVAIDAAGNQSSTQNLGASGRANPFLPL